MRNLLLPTLVLAAMLAPKVAAQGSDACSTAQAIAGAGTFSFDCTSATTGTEAQAEGLCNGTRAGEALSFVAVLVRFCECVTACLGR